ncbi:MAG: hypothetical protein NZT92_05790, partial [Abditibacteriales bacterium]|nr:hypothetical protein [Abditibacteriales bacterium]
MSPLRYEQLLRQSSSPSFVLELQKQPTTRMGTIFILRGEPSGSWTVLSKLPVRASGGKPSPTAETAVAGWM